MAINIAETPEGVAEFGGNELVIRSKVEDPPKVRMAAPHGISSGAVSFNRFIDGVQRENVLIQGKQDERYRDDPRSPAGEVTLHLNDGSSYEDAAMKGVLEIRHDTIRLFGVLFTRAQLERLAGL